MSYGTASDFVREFNSIADSNPVYGIRGTGKNGKCDCIGGTMGAMYALGRKKYDLHSSNYFARFQLTELHELYSADDCYIGQQVLKARGDTSRLDDRYHPGGAYYNGDMLDYYHAGVVVSVNPLQIRHCTSGGGVNGFTTDTKLGKWSHGGKVKGIDYTAHTNEGSLTIMAAIYDAKVVTTGGHLNFRSAPRVGGTDIGDIPNGTLLQVLAETNEDWSKVFYSGREGYVQRKFLQPILPTGDDTEDVSGDTVTIILPRSTAEKLYAALNNAL